MADVDVSTIYDELAVSEDVSVLAIDADPLVSTAEVINLSDYIDVAVVCEGGVTVADENVVQEILSADATYTKAVLPMRKAVSSGFLNISVSLTGTISVVLQRSFDKGLSWKDYATYTSSTEAFITDKEKGVLYRLGIKTGGYTSGAAICRLGIGG